MKPSTHMLVRNAFAGVCWFGLMVAATTCLMPSDQEASWGRRALTLVGLGVLAVVLTALATETLFRWVLPARCRHCGGRMRSRTDGTLKYRCTACGSEHDTGWRPGSGGEGGSVGADSGGGG